MNTLHSIEVAVAIRLLLNQSQLQDAIEGQLLNPTAPSSEAGFDGSDL
jgi:hypothetical protein